MRKTLVLILTVLLLAMAVAPAAASSTFVIKANGQVYDGYFAVYEGNTVVPLSFVEQAMPVTTKVDGDNIAITMNDQVISMQLGSRQALVNGQAAVMPFAAQTDQEQVVVPLRFVLENLGAKVGWDASTYEITVTSPVLKNGLTAEQTLSKITQAMTSQGRYKMKADTTMQMQMTADGQTQNIDMSGQVSGSIQEKPLLAYVTTEMKVENLTGTDEAIPPEALKSEVVMNDEGMFMTMPGYDGWVKMEMEGLDLNQLMEQYGSQDPVQSIMQMKEFGAVIAYEEDKVIDGKNYGVIGVAMDEESLGEYLNDILENTGLFTTGGAAANGTEITAMINQMMKSLKADISYSMVFDYETYLAISMDMDMNMDMTLDVPANEEAGTEAMSMQMNIKQQADYQLYDYGVEFEVPDVSDARSMAEVMAEMAAEMPDQPAQ